MPLPPNYFNAIADARDPSAGPLSILWPTPGDLSGAIAFATFSDWRAFVLALSPRRAIPAAVAAKFERAQKLYVLAWLDLDLIKAGELVALTALELALTDRYAARETERRLKLVAEKAEKALRPISKKEKWWTEYTAFADLLKFMVERDGLTNAQIPMIIRCGGAARVVDRLTGVTRPSLWDLRNDLAHGAPNRRLSGVRASGVGPRPHRLRLSRRPHARDARAAQILAVPLSGTSPMAGERTVRLNNGTP